jgi:hypothetical protein
MHDKLYDTLMKLPRHNLICLLDEALDIMQGYNGQSKTECIIHAIGGKIVEGDNGSIRFSIPKLKEIKKSTETMLQL